MSKSVSKFRKHKVYADDFSEKYSEQEVRKRSKPRDDFRPIKAYDALEQEWNTLSQKGRR